MNLQIVTPTRLAKEIAITSVTLPTAAGEITILSKHQPLLSLLVEGIVSYKSLEGDDMLAIGGGYVQTDGSLVRLLVSRSYGQEEIDEKINAEALMQAKKILSESKDKTQIKEAQAIMRRSLIDSKLIKRRKHSTAT
ncbi:MAG TPA: ATP synthase F1 subunit epsilon [Candidatus Woesebacteria bacterium]|nr:ATP synthase F1 subunit epsilon [Candidatus Woesebacteria bacterium]HNS94527.1 ATP synthase F1 subunit epsilon [Candidatus Woesebacteria bacterium]